MATESFSVSLTVGSVGVMVMTPDGEWVGYESKYSTGIFSFLKEMTSLIWNTKSGNTNVNTYELNILLIVRRELYENV